jgi:hypothetical protein
MSGPHPKVETSIDINFAQYHRPLFVKKIQLDELQRRSLHQKVRIPEKETLNVVKARTIVLLFALHIDVRCAAFTKVNASLDHRDTTASFHKNVGKVREDYVCDGTMRNSFDNDSTRTNASNPTWP